MSVAAVSWKTNTMIHGVVSVLIEKNAKSHTAPANSTSNQVHQAMMKEHIMIPLLQKISRLNLSKSHSVMSDTEAVEENKISFRREGWVKASYLEERAIISMGKMGTDQSYWGSNLDLNIGLF